MVKPFKNRGFFDKIKHIKGSVFAEFRPYNSLSANANFTFMLNIKKANIGETGISIESVKGFIEDLQKAEIPMHSFILMHKDTIISEGYYAPTTKDSLHRMFSISKSLTALGIGLLIDEGKLSLSDKIIDYFPDKLPKEIHPWLAATTIEHMLSMRTCHDRATYVINQTPDWTESFFTVKPALPPGRLFYYDTSAAQVMCSLVERITGMPLLDYLKVKFAELELSSDSYMLKAPCGASIGGSGLMATSMDMMKIGYLLSHKGNIGGRQLISSDYISRITSKISDTRFNVGIPAEADGYGMQIWRYKRNGYMCYGMGGQFIIVIPDKELVLVTTADTQGINGGNQAIHDAFLNNIVDKIQAEPILYSNEELREYEKMLDNLALASVPYAQFESTQQLMSCLKGKVFKMDDNPHFDNFSFEFTPEGGTVSYTLDGQNMSHSFGFGKLIKSIFPKYDMTCYSSGTWTTEDTLYIKMNVLDAFLGTILMEFSFLNNEITMAVKKIEESIFTEYNGLFHGCMM